MGDRPTTSDREQQLADNLASRRQSGLEPLPRDLQDAEALERERKAKRAAREQAKEKGKGGGPGKGKP